MKEGQRYGGRPEHCAPEPLQEEKPSANQRHRKKRFSPEGLANLRASMLKARAIRDAKRAKEKANA